jgi:thymidylate kinase
MAIEIYLEGSDLSGKSTIAESILELSATSYKLQELHLSSCNQIYDFAMSLSHSNYSFDVLEYLFLSAVTNDIDNFDNDTTPILQCSAKVARTLSFHKAQETQFIEMIERQWARFPKPKNSFYVHASIEERRKRLVLRQQNSKAAEEDLLVLENPELFQRAEEHLRAIVVERFDTMVIDTTGRTALESAQLILDSLNV